MSNQPGHEGTGGREPAPAFSIRCLGTHERLELAKVVAALVVEELREELGLRPVPAGLVDAGELAGLLGVARSWVYEHADELGVIRLGDGARPRLRFDADLARERFATCSESRGSAAPRPNAGGRSGAARVKSTPRLPKPVPNPDPNGGPGAPEQRPR
jgi:hypothetical protein